MEVLREDREVERPERGPDGFNPCFDGSVERGIDYPAPALRRHVVSILVLMEVLREAKHASRFKGQSYVSILVLMEVLREEDAGDLFGWHNSCFNPCFDGSVERGPRRAGGPGHFRTMFQSLF